MSLSPLVLLALAFGIGAIIAAIAIPLLIAWQRRLAIGQQVYEDGPASHADKQGTPTMGGVAFVLAAIAGTVVAYWQGGPSTWHVPLLLLVTAAAAIGFADDYLKVVRKRALGLRARAKFALLIAVALAFVAWASTQHVYAAQWFSGFIVLPQWLWWVLALCAIVGAANAVNLTDGLDGLAAGTAVPPLWLFSFLFADALPAAVLGACVAFLYYNRHPARIFMGDTGSLALGALLAGLAIEYDFLLLLPIIGIVFVAEALSVIAQVASFKTTGRRIFAMTPLHHHFELKGWREQRVTTMFIVTSACAAILTFVLLAFAPPGQAN
ncbi:MAG: phospho-N-acetylmuramoyl-pentapeptide-transferase [Candidatus Eremiobacteraeota bacterium]|nr:phospho-N-acetylmuramoyl-pentapeptide-transferase [Candidatus Eremiobacteraeota bacterium]